jgi:endonuclease/exonuclease/phosphatase family metal-dependent hydrolase
MKLKFCLPACAVALLLSLAVLPPPATAADGAATNAAPREVTLVHWNVENLFDNDDDPASKGDDPYTERGWEHWTTNLYRLKLDHLAELLIKMDGDIVSVCEVENRRVLEDLNQAIAAKGGRPYTSLVQRDSSDERGIDTAILSRFAPVTNRWLRPIAGQRDVVIADFLVGGQPLTVLANHWKSHFGPKKESEDTRRAEAAAVRKELDAILSSNRTAAVIMMGDFNDDFTRPSLVEVARALTNVAEVGADKTGLALFDLHATLPADQAGTLYYRKGKYWDSFDSICVSRAMVDAKDAGYRGWRVKSGTYGVFRDPRHLSEEKWPKPFRRSYDPQDDDPARRGYIEGFSDHFPVRVVLTLEKP